MIINKVESFLFGKNGKALLFLYFVSFCLLHSQEKEKRINFNLTGVTIFESNGKSVEGVKLEVQKNKSIIETFVTPANGKFKLASINVTTDSNRSEYRLTFTKANMVPKTVTINTYIKNPLASSYDFVLEVNMIESKEGDVIVDLPSAKIKWDTRINKFGFDQKYANIMRKIKEQEDPKKAQELIALQKKEEEMKAKQEAERIAKEEAAIKAKENAERKAKEAELKAKEESEQAIKKNLEAIRLQSEQLAKEDAERKAKEEAEKKAEKESLKKTLGALHKQVEEIKEEEKVVPPPAPVSVEVEKSIESQQIMVQEIYSIRDIKDIRSQKSLLEKRLKKNLNKNYSSKYETENPLTSLLDEVDQYEKELKKQKAR